MVRVHVSSIMWIIKNQPSNSTSCSDNAIHLLVLVANILYWGLQVTSLFSNWGCVSKGCFGGGIFWRAKSNLKGIEDFNLEHWCRCPHLLVGIAIPPVWVAFQCPKRLLGIIGEDPNVSKSNRLHVDIFMFSLLFRSIFHRFLYNDREFFGVLNFKWFFVKLNRLICN